MQDIFKEIIKVKSEGGKAALATILSIQGPGPREEGAKILLKSDGTFIGTMGGGGLEYEVLKRAKQVIEKGEAQLFSFKLHEDVETGFISGGDTQIFIEPIS
ncbi:MAG: XdhC family protein [Thermodesulfobacteriota bacterium]|nr:XdhC family protein [Thermodesulfobacteriota bacterium]